MARQLTPQEKDRLASEGAWPQAEQAPAQAGQSVSPWVWTLVGVIVLLAAAGGAILGFSGGRLFERSRRIDPLPPTPTPVPVIVVPIEPVVPVYPGGYQNGRLGIAYRMVQPGDPFEVADGALIISFLDERTPAELADLRPGDIITAIDGQTITEWNDLEAVLAAFAPGERVRLTVYRAGDEIEATVRLG